MPTVDAAIPLPVAMTLDEARSEVWSWLDPAHAPRIVSVDYIPGAAVAAFRYNTGEWHVFDSFGGLQADRLLEENGLPPTLVRVVAESAPLDAPLLAAPTGFRVGGARPLNGDPSRLVALFDATTGTRLAALPADHRPGPVIDTALAAPTAATTFRATLIAPFPTFDRPTWTPEPTPTTVPTPIGPTVEADSVPPAMRAVLTAYPLLPGSRWTWESTSWEGGVTWERSRMTETVQAAWKVDDNQLVVRSLLERERVFGPLPTGGGATRTVVWRAVTADAAVHRYPTQAGQKADDPRDASVRATAIAPLRLPLEAIAYPHKSFNWSWPEAVTSTRITVETPAGRFLNCGVFEVIGGSAWASVRAICPGIGYAETDSWHDGALGYGRSVTRLVDYDVVLPR